MNGKYEVPANQMIIIVLAAVNRDPAVFNHPLDFRPEQIMPGKFENYLIGVSGNLEMGRGNVLGRNMHHGGMS